MIGLEGSRLGLEHSDKKALVDAMANMRRQQEEEQRRKGTMTNPQTGQRARSEDETLDNIHQRIGYVPPSFASRQRYPPGNLP